MEVVRDRTAELQALVDGPDQVIDLRGELWETRRLTLTVRHHGKAIQFGRIKFLGPDGKPQYQLVEIIQGRKWNGIVYPGGDVDVTLRGVTLDGSFYYDSGLQEHNELVADQEQKTFNLIGSSMAGHVRLENCVLINCGQSGWGGSCKSFTAIGCKAYHVSKHVFALPGWGGMRVFIDGLETVECGNSFDLSNPVKEFREYFRPDIADIRNVRSLDNRGRTKLASPNWFARFKDCRFEQSDIVSMNVYPGLDNSYNTHQIAIDGLTVVNCAYGFGALSDSVRRDGTIEIRNSRFEGCFTPVKCQQRMTLDGVSMEGHFQKYISGTPIERNVTATNPRPAQYWAGVFDAINRKYEAFNAQHGTAYRPAITLPRAITDLMETQ
jgi:hypothetical protein